MKISPMHVPGTKCIVIPTPMRVTERDFRWITTDTISLCCVVKAERINHYIKMQRRPGEKLVQKFQERSGIPLDTKNFN